tara:strand:- start:279 stop:503 length:225 start_codon:yes stop_codon:yes gene_type:complete
MGALPLLSVLMKRERGVVCDGMTHTTRPLAVVALSEELRGRGYERRQAPDRRPPGDWKLPVHETVGNRRVSFRE